MQVTGVAPGEIFIRRFALGLGGKVATDAQAVHGPPISHGDPLTLCRLGFGRKDRARTRAVAIHACDRELARRRRGI
jgi:hypothetical protein